MQQCYAALLCRIGDLSLICKFSFSLFLLFYSIISIFLLGFDRFDVCLYFTMCMRVCDWQYSVIRQIQTINDSKILREKLANIVTISLLISSHFSFSVHNVTDFPVFFLSLSSCPLQLQPKKH